MKKIFFALTIVTGIVSCNSTSIDENHADKKDSASMSMMQGESADKDIPKLQATFQKVDPAVSAFMKTLTNQYLSVKNALIDGQAEKAAGSSSAMVNTLKKFDKSLLSAEQKTVYDGVESGLKEHGVMIAQSTLEQQREHFIAISNNMYNLVKAFGAGMVLYHDHCPMYKDGSMWLSETKDIRNPYYGDNMMTCGNAEEMFQ